MASRSQRFGRTVICGQIAPRVARVAFLFNPATATYAEYYLNPRKAVAPSLAVELIAAPVLDTSEFESVVASQAREPNSGLIVMPDTFLNPLDGQESARLSVGLGLE
jgi:hypothetical protein